MSAALKLTRKDIRHLFVLLNRELELAGTHAELYVFGGAVMCLALGARAATVAVDTLSPSQPISWR